MVLNWSVRARGCIKSARLCKRRTSGCEVCLIFSLLSESIKKNNGVKMNGFKLLGLLITIVLCSYNSASAQWKTSKNVDKMTGTGSSYAHSPSVNSDPAMDFPYNNVRAWLGVGCDENSEWAYIGLNESPNLTDTKTQDGYDRIKTRIKWDDLVKEVELTQKWGDNFLSFTNDGYDIAKIQSSNTVLLELKWYGEGDVYFEFPLNGSSKAINKIRRECKSYN